MRNPDPVLAIPLSFVAAVLLSLCPIPEPLDVCRPDWLLIMLVFWTLHQPEWVGIWTAFVAGLLLDVVYGTAFGIFPFSLCLVAWIARWQSRRLRLLPIPFMALGFGLLSLVAMSVRYVLQDFQGHLPGSPLYWMPVFGNIVAWPLAAILLQHWQRPLNRD